MQKLIYRKEIRFKRNPGKGRAYILESTGIGNQKVFFIMIDTTWWLKILLWKWDIRYRQVKELTEGCPAFLHFPN